MAWMNASAVTAADRRNTELSAWDHSVESPDGMGRRNVDDRGGEVALPPGQEYGQMKFRTEAELKAEADRAAAEEQEMLAAMMASSEY